jgi:O-antigen ligase
MASTAVRFVRAPDSGALTRSLWLPVAAAFGLALGVAATVDLKTAVVLAAALAIAPLVLVFPALMPPILIVTVFTQVLSVGGLTISRIIAPLALFVILVALHRGGYTLRAGPPLGWVCAYALWAVASGLWTVHLDDTITSLSSLAIALTYMFAFAILVRSRRECDRVLYTLAAVALVTGVIGIATSQGRAAGPSGNPNFFAMVQIFALPLVLALAADVQRRVVRLGLYVVVFVIVFSVFASLSRGGFLTLVAVAVAALVLPARSSFFQSQAHKAVVLALVAAFAFVAYKAESGTLAPRLESIFAKDETGAGRTNVWRGAWTSIKERPVFGLGYGSFISEANQLMLRTPGNDLTDMTLRPRGLYAHSAYIETAAEVGIPGLILFLGMLTTTAGALWRAAVRARDVGAGYLMRVANASLISLVAWCIASLFASSETSRPLWILIGMSLALPVLLDEHEGARNADDDSSVVASLKP